MAAAAATESAEPQIELIPASRSVPLFLTRYGEVPSGYAGIIILPSPADTVNAAAAVVLQKHPGLEAAFRLEGIMLDISDTAAIQSDVLAANATVAPSPLPTPGRMGTANPDPGDEGPMPATKGLQSLISATKVSSHPDPGDEGPMPATKGLQSLISATKVSSHSDPGDKGTISTKGSTDSGLGVKGSAYPGGSKRGKRKRSKYSDDVDKKISDHVKIYFPKPVDWGSLAKELGRPRNGLERRWYKIRHLYPDIGVDKRSARWAVKIAQHPPLKDRVSEDTPDNETAKTAEDCDPPKNVAAVENERTRLQRRFKKLNLPRMLLLRTLR